MGSYCMGGGRGGTSGTGGGGSGAGDGGGESENVDESEEVVVPLRKLAHPFISIVVMDTRMVMMRWVIP